MSRIEQARERGGKSGGGEGEEDEEEFVGEGKIAEKVLSSFRSFAIDTVTSNGRINSNRFRKLKSVRDLSGSLATTAMLR